MNYKKSGFTLAEVLITLGIIGVVAAMTIPALMTNISQKRNQAMLKEDYAIISQVMKLALDSGKLAAFQGAGNNISDMKKWYDDTLLPHLKTVNVCYDEPGCWSGTEKTLNGQRGDSASSKNGCGQATISFTLNNGSTVCFDDFSASVIQNNFGVNNGHSGIGLVFYVDVNGTNLPNVYGKDIFLLVYDMNTDTLVPAGISKTDEEIKRDCSLTGSGRFCAAYASRNGWKLPKF